MHNFFDDIRKKNLISARKFNVFRSFFMCVFSLFCLVCKVCDKVVVPSIPVSNLGLGWECLTILDNDWPVRHIITIDETPLSSS